MVFIDISLISAAALASPWILYQLWQFVAAGLYPHERKYVTRYLPLSIALLISGMLFVYFLVLPWTLEFFIDVQHAASRCPGADRRRWSPRRRPGRCCTCRSLKGEPAKPWTASCGSTRRQAR